MRIPIDPEFLEKAKAEGLPMFRIQIDWRFVPEGKRNLKSHESCGYTTLDKATGLLWYSLRDLAELYPAGADEGARFPDKSDDPTAD